MPNNLQIFGWISFITLLSLNFHCYVVFEKNSWDRQNTSDHIMAQYWNLKVKFYGCIVILLFYKGKFFFSFPYNTLFEMLFEVINTISNISPIDVEFLINLFCIKSLNKAPISTQLIGPRFMSLNQISNYNVEYYQISK